MTWKHNCLFTVMLGVIVWLTVLYYVTDFHDISSISSLVWRKKPMNDRSHVLQWRKKPMNDSSHVLQCMTSGAWKTRAMTSQEKTEIDSFLKWVDIISKTLTLTKDLT